MSVSWIDFVKESQFSGFGQPDSNPTVGNFNPPSSVGDVLSAIGFSQAHGIGTSNERRDAFGRIIDSGLTNTSPAATALGMIRGGVLGRFLTSAFTNKPFYRGLGTGIGAVMGKPTW